MTSTIKETTNEESETSFSVYELADWLLDIIEYNKAVRVLLTKEEKERMLSELAELPESEADIADVLLNHISTIFDTLKESKEGKRKKVGLKRLEKTAEELAELTEEISAFAVALPVEAEEAGVAEREVSGEVVSREEVEEEKGEAIKELVSEEPTATEVSPEEMAEQLDKEWGDDLLAELVEEEGKTEKVGVEEEVKDKKVEGEVPGFDGEALSLLSLDVFEDMLKGEDFSTLPKEISIKDLLSMDAAEEIKEVNADKEEVKEEKGEVAEEPSEEEKEEEVKIVTRPDVGFDGERALAYTLAKISEAQPEVLNGLDLPKETPADLFKKVADVLKAYPSAEKDGLIAFTKWAYFSAWEHLIVDVDAFIDELSDVAKELTAADRDIWQSGYGVPAVLDYYDGRFLMDEIWYKSTRILKKLWRRMRHPKLYSPARKLQHAVEKIDAFARIYSEYKVTTDSHVSLTYNDLKNLDKALATVWKLIPKLTEVRKRHPVLTQYQAMELTNKVTKVYSKTHRAYQKAAPFERTISEAIKEAKRAVS